MRVFTGWLLLAAVVGWVRAEEVPGEKPGGLQMPPAEIIGEITKRIFDDPDGRITELGKQLLGDRGTDLMFYFPTRDEPATPREYGLNFEEVEFASKDGTALHGWFIPAQGAESKATIVFSHGNAGSIGHHLPFIGWLPAKGFDVFMYDYRGYGKSGGSIDRRGMVEDAAAAFHAVGERPDVDRLVSLAHSMGGAKSVVGLAQDRPKGLRGVVVISSFASYRQMARIWGGKVGANLTDDKLAPQEFIGKLVPVPVLVVHGDADEVIPFAEGRVLAAAAREPKEFMAIPGGRHADVFTADDGKWRRRILGWIEERVR